MPHWIRCILYVVAGIFAFNVILGILYGIVAAISLGFAAVAGMFSSRKTADSMRR